MMRVKFFVHHNDDEPEHQAFVREGAVQPIVLWLYGYNRKPSYAINIIPKHTERPHGRGTEEGTGL